MIDDRQRDHRLRVWIEAAHLARRKSQQTAALRLLIVAIDEALQAGRPVVADELLAFVQLMQPGHRAAVFDSASSFRRSDDGNQLIASARRLLRFEEVEAWVDATPPATRYLMHDVTDRSVSAPWLDDRF